MAQHNKKVNKQVKPALPTCVIMAASHYLYILLLERVHMRKEKAVKVKLLYRLYKKGFVVHELALTCQKN